MTFQHRNYNYYWRIFNVIIRDISMGHWVNLFITITIKFILVRAVVRKLKNNLAL